MAESEKVWAGVDPGATGAIAILTEGGLEGVFDWPGDECALARLLVGLDLDYGRPEAVIERQQAMPKQGVASTFKIGENYGVWRGVMAALGWKFRPVRACDWKKGLGYPAKDYDASKKHSLKLARQRFPGLADRLARVKDNGRAEALLLADACRRGAAR